MFHGIKWATLGVRKVFTPCPPPLGTTVFSGWFSRWAVFGTWNSTVLQGSSGLALSIARILFVRIRILVSVGKRNKTSERYVCFKLITSHADIQYTGLNLPITVPVYSSPLNLDMWASDFWEAPEQPHNSHLNFSVNKDARLNLPQISVFTHCISKFVLSTSLTLRVTERHPGEPGASSKHLPWQLPPQDWLQWGEASVPHPQPGCSLPRCWMAGLGPGDWDLARQQTV